MTPLERVAAQLDAYNRQDLDGHCAHFSEDVEVADVGGGVRFRGKEAYRATYKKVFTEFPKNRAEIVNRMQIGDRIIDHERVRRSLELEPFEVLAIYSFRDGVISRVDFVR
ncbi:NTF2 enzyme family protein [bacterium]|nr:NTF2 enzyme family protein [bacterium]